MDKEYLGAFIGLFCVLGTIGLAVANTPSEGGMLKPHHLASYQHIDHTQESLHTDAIKIGD